MNGCCCVCPPRRGSGWGLGYLTRCHLLQDLGCTTTNSRSISWTAAHSPLAAAATDARVEDWTAGPASSINPAAQHHPWLDTPFLLEIGSGRTWASYFHGLASDIQLLLSGHTRRISTLQLNTCDLSDCCSRFYFKMTVRRAPSPPRHLCFTQMHKGAS